MGRPAEAVIERQRVREVAGIFHSREALNDAVQALLLAGFDRADIDLMAGLDAVRQRLGFVYVAPEELADIPQVPRRPYVAPEDITSTKWMMIGIFAFASAAAAALVVIAAGGSTALTVVIATLGGVLAGGLAAWLIARAFRREQDESLAATMAARGIALWVRVRSTAREDEARRILQEHGGRAVRVHEIDLTKRTDDIPLSSLRPDPWLGSERLDDL
jgi:hypothetical protein